jgi:hypothetical protein
MSGPVVMARIMLRSIGKDRRKRHQRCCGQCRIPDRSVYVHDTLLNRARLAPAAERGRRSPLFDMWPSRQQVRVLNEKKIDRSSASYL